VQGNEDWRITQLEKTSERHERDLYFGNGKPGITTRMEKVEEAMSSMKFYFRWIVLLIGGLLVKEVVPAIGVDNHGKLLDQVRVLKACHAHDYKLVL